MPSTPPLKISHLYCLSRAFTLALDPALSHSLAETLAKGNSGQSAMEVPNGSIELAIRFAETRAICWLQESSGEALSRSQEGRLLRRRSPEDFVDSVLFSELGP